LKTVENIKEILSKHKDELREKYGVSRIGIFGSYARAENTEISDVDILVEFERPIGLEFIELADYLEKILEVRVDLLTYNAIKQKPKLWESVQKDLNYV